MTLGDLATLSRGIIEMVESAIVGKDTTVEMALAVLLSDGHLLIEDIPGVGKTTLAKALAKALGLTFKRIQFTPDLLPSDITGSTIYNQKTNEFEMRPGPVFANVVLADEINRTTPKTQAALLECMEERQVSLDGTTYKLPLPFFVIATQNNVELSGTYSLPEAQLDRFAARITIGYPDRAAEQQIIRDQRLARPIDAVAAVVTPEQVLAMQAAVRDVTVDSAVEGYALDIVQRTRTHEAVALGASPRASLALLHAAQALAALRGRAYVMPDDVKVLAIPVLAHRLIVSAERRIRGAAADAIVSDIVQSVGVPVPVRA